MEFFQKNRKFFVYLSAVFIIIFAVMVTTDNKGSQDQTQNQSTDR